MLEPELLLDSIYLRPMEPSTYLVLGFCKTFQELKLFLSNLQRLEFSTLRADQAPEDLPYDSNISYYIKIIPALNFQLS